MGRRAAARRALGRARAHRARGEPLVTRRGPPGEEGEASPLGGATAATLAKAATGSPKNIGRRCSGRRRVRSGSNGCTCASAWRKSDVATPWVAARSRATCEHRAGQVDARASCPPEAIRAASIVIGGRYRSRCRRHGRSSRRSQGLGGAAAGAPAHTLVARRVLGPVRHPRGRPRPRPARRWRSPMVLGLLGGIGIVPLGVSSIPPKGGCQWRSPRPLTSTSYAILGLLVAPAVDHVRAGPADAAGAGAVLATGREQALRGAEEAGGARVRQGPRSARGPAAADRVRHHPGWAEGAGGLDAGAQRRTGGSSSRGWCGSSSRSTGRRPTCWRRWAGARLGGATTFRGERRDLAWLPRRRGRVPRAPAVAHPRAGGFLQGD